MGKRRSNDDLLVAAVVALTIGLLIGLIKVVGQIISGLSSANEKERKQALALLCGVGVIAGVIGIGAIVATNDSADYSSASSTSDVVASPPPVDRGPELTRAASNCIERADWDCAETKIAEAERHGASTTTERTRAASLLLTDAEASYTAAKKTRGKARTELVQRAAFAVERAKSFDQTISNGSNALQLAAKIKRAFAKPSKRVKAPAQEETPSTVDGNPVSDSVASVTVEPAPSVDSAEQPRPVPTSPSGQQCAENGSCYGDVSSITGRAKSVEVRGYYRKDGTYVRGHYRSR